MNINEIILTIMLSGFGLNFALMLMIWRRIDKIEERLTDIDRRLIVVETILHTRECCLLKDHAHMKKAE